MRYRTNSPWPVLGGRMIVPVNAVIDDTRQPPVGLGAILTGVIPPSDVTPMDQPTRDWLQRVYFGQTIREVG